jgi:peptidyl-prolyl cis-trans isomerase SurA
VRSGHGYHLIQLNDKRQTSDEVKSESEINELMRQSKDERMQLIEDAFVKKLKKVWDFEENQDALEIIYELADERVYKGNWAGPSNLSFDETIFVIDGKDTYQKDLIEFMESFETEERQLPISEYINSIYHKFVSYRLIQYENFKLDEKYPEFRFQYQEYRDAMMLLEITRQKVWLKAESDPVGMENYYRENKGKYPSEDEAHDMILADYRDYLMKKWIEELHSTFEVQINEDVLSSIVM